MPFLFVDYDQGAGGERFCAGLSQSAECESLEFKQYKNGRTKVLDVFRQEFLKPNPCVDSTIKPHNTLYTIVPTHRQTSLAKTIFNEVRSIRISVPVDPSLRSKIKEHQITKVLLTQEPTPEYFFGLVKILQETAVDKEFVKKVKYTMSTVEIVLISMGIEPTETNINKHFEYVRAVRLPEPEFDYDLIIPYEELAYRPDLVKEKIESKFKINVIGNIDKSISSSEKALTYNHSAFSDGTD
jgi:hypothetical protein